MIPASDLWMLGLQPVREPDPSPTCKYVIAPRMGRWGVRRNDADAGAFATLDDAVRFACGQARDAAQGGILGLVVVQAEVQEMHCFTPPEGARLSTPAPRPRLAGRPD